MFILTHWGYINNSASSYWPGADEVDIIAADGYNTGGCRTRTAAGRTRR